MIIDLDAHQGNGHEKDFSGDSMTLFVTCYPSIVVNCSNFSLCFPPLTGRVYILDMYNPDIYPFVSTY